MSKSLYILSIIDSVIRDTVIRKESWLMSAYPRIFRVRQKFDDPRLDDIATAMEDELTRLQLSKVVLAGRSAAISAGSRGITNVDCVTKAVVAHSQSTVS